MKTISDYTIYCTSEQTKKALELGAPIAFITCYSSRGVENAIDGRNNNEYTLVDNFQQSGDYWCKVITIPTAEQMIGILEDLGVWAEPTKEYVGNKVLYTYNVYWDSKSAIDCELRHISNEIPKYSSRKEATLAAIDAAMEYLIKNKTSIKQI